MYDHINLLRVLMPIQACLLECVQEKRNKIVAFILSQFHHMSLIDSVVSPPGCRRSVTDFRGWDVHEAQLRCPDEVDGDI
jgi:hypothetical protein